MKYFRSIFIIVLFLCKLSATSQQWRDVGGGADDQVYCFYHDIVSDLLYVGGDFEHLGGNVIHQIGIWDGTNWSAIGSNSSFTKNSFPGSVLGIAFLNGELIVAGAFDSVAGVPANNVARWDGAQWHSMGNGFDKQVLTLQNYNNVIYAGGEFEYSGNDTVYHIAKWDGINWVRLGSGIGVDNVVGSMVVHDNKLILSGLFTTIFSSSIPGRVTGWNGVNWISMNPAFNDGVSRVRIINDTLFAVGAFTSFFSNPSNYISKWDGLQWQSMPYPSGGSQPQVNDIVMYNNDIYVCGLFTSPPDIGRFNGTGYDPIGNVFGFLNTMIVYQTELFVGGGFQAIDGNQLYNIARYNSSTGLNENGNINEKIVIYPNPILGNQVVSIKLNQILNSGYLCIYNVRGELVDQIQYKTPEFEIKIKDQLESGVYFIVIIDADGIRYSVKLIVL